MPHSNLKGMGDIVPGLRKDLTVEQLQDPLALFKLFVDDAMLTNIAKQTNLYHSQLDLERAADVGARPWSPLDAHELCAWLGMVVCDSLHPFPSIKKYYSDEFVYSMPQMRDVMSLTRFEQIKRFLHIADRTKEMPRGAAGHDPLHKVRPLLSALQDQSSAIYQPGKMVSIDEMDIPFKGRSHLKSRVKFKKAGDGFLTYSLCDPANGYAYFFEFQFDPLIPVMKAGLAKTFNAVLHLASALPSPGHHIFADNLYSSAALAQELLSKGHAYTCTARSNRVPECVKQDTPRSTAVRAARKGTVKWASRGDVVALSVFDSKPVNMPTTGHRTLEEVEYTRKHPGYDQEAGTWKMIASVEKRLNVIDDYNNFMNGVDVADQLRTNYETRVKSNKWWHPIFWALINTARYLQCLHHPQSWHCKPCCSSNVTCRVPCEAGRITGGMFSAQNRVKQWPQAQGVHASSH